MIDIDYIPQLMEQQMFEFREIEDTWIIYWWMLPTDTHNIQLRTVSSFTFLLHGTIALDGPWPPSNEELQFRPRGKESTEVQITQNKGKESENSYQELKRSPEERWHLWKLSSDAIFVVCSHIFTLFWLTKTAVTSKYFDYVSVCLCVPFLWWSLQFLVRDHHRKGTHKHTET